MIDNLFSRAPLHAHADPAQRARGVAQLAPDSGELARLMTADPAPEVRAAAARQCTDVATLAVAWQTETDTAVRAVLVSALGNALDAVQDEEAPAQCDRSPSPTKTLLVELALGAEHAETRKAAAARVQTPAALRKLADAAKNRDRGVARFAQQQLDAIANRQQQTAEADAMIAQLEGLATQGGAIVSAVVDLDRRWQALDMSHDG